MNRLVVVALTILAAACAPKANPPPDQPAPLSTAYTQEDAGADAGADADATADGGAEKPCKKTGCSGTLCSDEDMVSTCEFKPEYACYRTATCERQPDGQCGFTKSAELDACLASPPPP